MYTFPTSIEGNSIQKPEKLFLLAINRVTKFTSKETGAY
ncbi:hypothetical protein T4A_5969 [Trichinella pseudospiralis]|uniref:Uncharacterized protein n=1 Tax=Trichinella pseudospiralis TaxID=6337 RepID=A0A0V1AQL0_TRIPS|nr:hypothetical protein T4A_5969 [Trichinella pseudospiralis]